ncbi:sesquipedalian-1 [Esox lucius]|uniref:Sesquipedalian n=1 Tax=Esox lucius TaxID=8010 RepID=A0AAY5K9F5_ESOLU|nr:sesquipedalian-1 [Esox lucius]
MKLNERSVAHYATCDSPPDKTGFLFKKGERNTAYHRRWFILKGNMLFYFEERESREPIGVIVLEGCTVELCESAEEFAFAVKFDCAKARVYKMAAENQAAMESWVKALSRASFDYMRLVVRELERQLEETQMGAGGLPGRPKSSRKAGGLVRSKSGALSSAPTTPSTQVTGGALTQGPAQGRTSEQEEVLLLSSNSKENGVTWSKPPVLVNGCADGPYSGVPWEGNGKGNGGGEGARPPPVPPRRRGASLESPVCPGTGCFAKLHDWYGKEVAELRAEWLQCQNDRPLISQTNC